MKFYGVAVTESMLAFAREQLPKLEKQAQRNRGAHRAKRKTRRTAQ